MKQDLTFELKVDEEGKVVDPLAALRQRRVDEKAAPSLGRQAQAVEDGSKRLKVALRDTVGAEDAPRPEPAVGEEDVGEDDADGEDPFRHVEADDGLHFTGPLVVGEQIDRSEGIGGIHGHGDDDQDPKPHV